MAYIKGVKDDLSYLADTNQTWVILKGKILGVNDKRAALKCQRLLHKFLDKQQD